METYSDRHQSPHRVHQTHHCCSRLPPLVVWCWWSWSSYMKKKGRKKAYITLVFGSFSFRDGDLIVTFTSELGPRQRHLLWGSLAFEYVSRLHYHCSFKKQPDKACLKKCSPPTRVTFPQVIDVRDLGVPLDTTFTASAHCIEAANTPRRLLFLVRRSFYELSRTAFTPLYSALVRPHLEYGMEADINQLERVQRLATRLVRGLRLVPYEERLRQLNLF